MDDGQCGNEVRLVSKEEIAEEMVMKLRAERRKEREKLKEICRSTSLPCRLQGITFPLVFLHLLELIG